MAEATHEALTLSGKVAIVTGGASGIGLACARRLAADGAKVVIADVNDPSGLAAAATIAEAGGQVRYVHASSSERLDVHNLIASTLEAYGYVDILITAASANVGAPFLELSEEQFDRLVRTNLKGTFLCAQAVARQFISQIAQGRPPGVIITTGAATLVMSQAGPANAASSGGIVHLTQSIAADLKTHGIRVNTIGLQHTADPGVEPNDQDDDKRAGNASLPAASEPQPGEELEDVAALTAWLVSDAAAHITGETVYVGDRRMLLSDPA